MQTEIRQAPNDICEDCGALVPDGKAGCLKIFEEVIAKEFGDYRYARTHRLTVDAYSLQHPEPYMRSGKSFAAHLTGMCAALEYDATLEINRAVQKWLNGPRVVDKPTRLPDHRGELTILHVRAEIDPEEHHKRVREWARSVWRAWREYHDLAKQWISEATIHGS